MFFIIVNTVHVSGGPSAHHQEPIKLCAALGIVILSTTISIRSTYCSIPCTAFI